MTDDVELQIKKEFIAEAAEMLEAVESAFIEFERNPDDGRVIDKIFRLAHTIKGSALSCGFHELGEFAHIVETLLVRIREKKLSTTPDIVDVLLKANDRLAEFVNALRQDMSSVVATEDVAALIQEALAASGASVTSGAPAGDVIDGFGFFEDEPKPVAAGAELGEIRKATGELVAFGLDAYLAVIRLTQAMDGKVEIDFAPTIRSVEVALEAMMQLRDKVRAG